MGFAHAALPLDYWARTLSFEITLDHELATLYKRDDAVQSNVSSIRTGPTSFPTYALVVKVKYHTLTARPADVTRNA